MFHSGAGKRFCSCTISHSLCGHTTLGEKPYRCRCDDALLAHRTVDDCCDTCEQVRTVSASTSASESASDSSSHFEFGDGKALCACTTTFELCGHRSLGEKPALCRCEGDGEMWRDRFVGGVCDSCLRPWLQSTLAVSVSVPEERVLGWSTDAVRMRG